MKNIIGLGLILFATPALATCYFTGGLRYQNEYFILPTEMPYTKQSVPRTPQFENWLRDLPLCSADAQGQPIYQIIDKQLFLTDFRYCGSEPVDLKKLYPDLWQKQDLENQQIWQNNLTWWQKVLQYFDLLEPYQADNKLKATWFNGELKAYTGKPSEIDCALPDTEYVFTVQNGQIQQLTIRPTPPIN